MSWSALGQLGGDGALDPDPIRAAADVLIVGAGAAGLMAAIEAADAGAQVLVLQKLPEPGGKSSLAIGSISAAGTSMQRACGIDDTVEAHLADVRKRIAEGGIPPLSVEKLDIAIRQAAASIERLIELGIKLTGPHPELPNEPWRMHVVAPDARTMVATLADQARRRRVLIRGDWPVDRLIRNRDGRAVGVSGPRGSVLTRSSVVLATGDFTSAPTLGLEPPIGAEHAFRPWSTGDGHHMAQCAGAELTHLDRPLRLQLRSVDWPHIEPNPGLFRAGAILVDQTGRRVVDELDNPAQRLAEIGAGDMYLILDGAVLAGIASAADDSEKIRDGWLRTGKLYIATFPGIAYAYLDDVLAAGYAAIASTPALLARRLGLDADRLRHALDPDGTRRPCRRSSVALAPYAGIGPFRAAAVLGRAGIRTDAQMRVLRTDGALVPGLLAVGAAAGPTGYAYGHGYEFAWAIASGRIAGRLAATPAHDPSAL